ncbi:hypothetical protein TVAG_412580 [Trichomonas vaginalis G3]|uniref:Uncharacterized protein n=1 Tax=Trichomonas vaginalis (strain ATCC PRA-98 / G3) TaxID=412133 RepID=A2EV71_TRIV3|nr:hypothetical protein TVAGG3_0936090 [Trichomonas vaginalis G3]EAY03454.1 hypothetical protein TVAG_412580 [Trichomonas vaginalis G3]KAI5486188.1 hypothetical protein TVAGG3_0936090 [Trichomonas vaginalis G3]|eukprot:XP_001315677.1 hypothetical protein [Trichomonas vaginalis G3]
MLISRITKDRLVRSGFIDITRSKKKFKDYGVWNGSILEINLSGEFLTDTVIDLNDKAHSIPRYEKCFRKPEYPLTYYPDKNNSYNLTVEITENMIIYPKIINCKNRFIDYSFVIKNPGPNIDSRFEKLKTLYLVLSCIHFIGSIALLFIQYYFASFGALLKSITTFILFFSIKNIDILGSHCFLIEYTNYFASGLFLYFTFRSGIIKHLEENSYDDIEMMIYHIFGFFYSFVLQYTVIRGYYPHYGIIYMIALGANVLVWGDILLYLGILPSEVYALSFLGFYILKCESKYFYPQLLYEIGVLINYLSIIFYRYIWPDLKDRIDYSALLDIIGTTF